MEKVYVLCYLFANEIEDIRVCTSFAKALDKLSKLKKSHQILEYNIVDGISQSEPVFAYYYESDCLISHQLKKSTEQSPNHVSNCSGNAS